MGPVPKALSPDEDRLAAKLELAAERMYSLLWHLPPESQMPIQSFGLFVSQDSDGDMLYFDRQLGLCCVTSSRGRDDFPKLASARECLSLFSMPAIRLAVSTLNRSAQELEESIAPPQPPTL